MLLLSAAFGVGSLYEVHPLKQPSRVSSDVFSAAGIAAYNTALLLEVLASEDFSYDASGLVVWTA